MFGIIIGIIYTTKIDKPDPKNEEIQKDIRKKLQKLMNIIKTSSPTQITDFKSTLLKDYEISNKETERRENITLVVGTIMITSSFIILGNSFSQNVTGSRVIGAIASIMLFLLWAFILHYTSRQIDGLSYARMKAIEETLSDPPNYQFGIHSFLFKQWTGKKKRIVLF